MNIDLPYLIGSLWRRFVAYFLQPMREALIDLRGLSVGTRVLAMVGYVTIFLLLGYLLLVEVFNLGGFLVTFSVSEKPLQIPIVVMMVCSVGMAFGWAFVLTGATDGRRRVLLPVAGLFAVQLFLFVPSSALAISLWCLVSLVLMGGLVGGHFFTKGKALWTDYPLAEFGMWVIALLFFILLFWFFTNSNVVVAEQLNAGMSVLILLGFIFWLGSGLAVVDLGVRISRGITDFLRTIFPTEILMAVTVLLVFIRPATGMLALVLFDRAPNLAIAIFLDGGFSVVFMLWLVGLALSGRWERDNVLLVLGVSLVTPVITLGLLLALSNTDISDSLEIALESAGIFPPTLIFVGLIVHSVLSSGSQFANKDTDILPRTGRVPLVFGAGILVTSFMIFFTNVRDATTGTAETTITNAIEGLFPVSLFLLGLPYLLWIVWRERDRLLAPPKALENFDAIFASGDGRSGRNWIIASLAGVILFSCGTCGFIMIFAAIQGG
jgi:hypothetical protein